MSIGRFQRGLPNIRPGLHGRSGDAHADRPIGVVVALIVSLLAAVIAIDEFHARQGDAASHSSTEENHECS